MSNMIHNRRPSSPKLPIVWQEGSNLGLTLHRGTQQQNALIFKSTYFMKYT